MVPVQICSLIDCWSSFMNSPFTPWPLQKVKDRTLKLSWCGYISEHVIPISKQCYLPQMLKFERNFVLWYIEICILVCPLLWLKENLRQTTLEEELFLEGGSMIEEISALLPMNLWWGTTRSPWWNKAFILWQGNRGRSEARLSPSLPGHFPGSFCEMAPVVGSQSPNSAQAAVSLSETLGIPTIVPRLLLNKNCWARADTGAFL